MNPAALIAARSSGSAGPRIRIGCAMPTGAQLLRLVQIRDAEELRLRRASACATSTIPWP